MSARRFVAAAGAMSPPLGLWNDIRIPSIR